MAPTRRSRTGTKRRSAKRASSTRKTKKSSSKARSYTILKKSSFDPKKKLSSQGKTKTTTKTGAHLAARVALAKTKRPSRIYLYRRKKIMTYSISYGHKDGKLKAVAKLIRTKSAKRKTSSSKKKSTTKKKKKRTTKKKSINKKKRATTAEIDLARKRLATLIRSRRRTM